MGFSGMERKRKENALKGILLALKGTLPAFKSTLPAFKSTLPAFKGTLPALKGTLSAFTGTLQALQGSILASQCPPEPSRAQFSLHKDVWSPFSLHKAFRSPPRPNSRFTRPSGALHGPILASQGRPEPSKTQFSLHKPPRSPPRPHSRLAKPPELFRGPLESGTRYKWTKKFPNAPFYIIKSYGFGNLQFFLKIAFWSFPKPHSRQSVPGAFQGPILFHKAFRSPKSSMGLPCVSVSVVAVVVVKNVSTQHA